MRSFSGTLYLSSGDSLDNVHYLKVQIFLWWDKGRQLLGRVISLVFTCMMDLSSMGAHHPMHPLIPFSL